MDPNRVLIVYFSRTGTTRDVALAIRDRLGCEIEPILDRTHRMGVFGYLRSGYDAFFQRPTELGLMRTNPSDYDLVIVGTPIWNMSLSAPVRAYLKGNRDLIRRVAFFCTHGSSGGARVLRQMEAIAGKSPIATLVLREKEVRRGTFDAAVQGFVSRLGGEAPPARPVPAPPLRPVPV